MEKGIFGSRKQAVKLMLSFILWEHKFLKLLALYPSVSLNIHLRKSFKFQLNYKKFILTIYHIEAIQVCPNSTYKETFLVAIY